MILAKHSFFLFKFEKDIVVKNVHEKRSFLWMNENIFLDNINFY